jgi:hypothetical protein
MEYKNIVKNAAYSFIALPMIMTNITSILGGVALEANVIGAADTEESAVVEIVNPSSSLVVTQAKKIDAFYASRNMPLEGHGLKMVQEARKNGIDPYLVAAIGVIESTGGIHACYGATFSAFGWGSCGINFDSYDHSIEVISWNLGGGNPNTPYKTGMPLKQVIDYYNPPSIRKDYHYLVTWVMDAMENFDV